MSNRDESISSGSVDPQRQLDDLWGFVKSLRRDFEAEKDELWDELEELQAENHRLRQELKEVQERTNLLRLIDENETPDGKKAQALLIQHLHEEAKHREREYDKRPTAEVGYEDACRALQFPDVKRATVYTWLRRAPDLVDDEDVLKYKDGSLKLNLTAGELPERFGSDTEVFR